MRLSDARGQTTTEYAGLLLLVAALTAGAGAAVGLGDVASAVAGGVRTGICIVAGDVCRASDARAAGLSPCVAREATRGAGLKVTIASVRLGRGDEWTVATRSDGTVLVTQATERSAGVEAGIGIEAGPLGLEWGAEGKLDYAFGSGRAWEFPDAEAAADFLGGEREGVEPAWRYGEAGAELGAEAGASVGGATLTGVESTARLAAGVRVGRGRVTYYVHGRLDLLDAVAWLPGESGRWSGPSTGDAVIEVTREHGELREIAFRRVEDRDGRVVETVARLDLRDPGNRAAAEPLLRVRLPWPPSVAHDLGVVVRRSVRIGVVERAVYDVRDRSRDLELSAKFGLALGIDAERVDIARRLVAASAWTNGSAARDRADCGVTGAPLERTS